MDNRLFFMELRFIRKGEKLEAIWGSIIPGSFEDVLRNYDNNHQNFRD
jgi:hypothetical protein